MERVRVEEFGKSKWKDCGWVNIGFLYGFSLKILPSSSLHFVGIRVFIVVYVRNMKRHFSAKQVVLATHTRLGWVASSSREIIDWQDCLFCPVVLQLSWPFSFLHALHVWHFGESLVASHSRVPVARMLLNAHTLGFFTLSHTQPLHDSHLNSGYLITEIEANLARNKANTWLNKFNLTISPFGYFVTKP